jgi:uncharacterized membrane protein HdeD (DUF308 family)
MTRSNPEIRDPMVPLFSTIRNIQQNWQGFLALGIILIILGFLAVGAATYTSLMTVVFLGVILLIGGIAKLVYSFWVREWSGFFLSLLIGLFYTVTGALFLAKPIAALAALTLIIGSLFVISGVFKIVAALSYRFEHWGWILFSGVISLLLGGLVLAEWPAASLWVIGLFVGIDLIFYGWTWVILALGARQA